MKRTKVTMDGINLSFGDGSLLNPQEVFAQMQGFDCLFCDKRASIISTPGDICFCKKCYRGFRLVRMAVKAVGLERLFPMVLIDALRDSNFNQTVAAERLRISTGCINYWIHKFSFTHKKWRVNKPRHTGE